MARIKERQNLFSKTFLLIIFLVFAFFSFDVSASGTVKFSNTHTSNLWERIRDGFALAAIDHSEVRKYENSFTRNPENFQKVLERSRPYLYHIVDELEQRGIPSEFVLLPFIESSFNPHAQSEKGAVGLWQFMPQTGRNLGLNQNEWHDDRKDVVAATSAALDYLQNLHQQLGDWKLVLAAYNFGEGAVKQARKNNREKGLSDNYFQIELPSQTRNLVHKLAAVKNIIDKPEKFGIQLKSIPNKPYFKAIKANDPIDISLAAELANISINEFNALNPAYKSAIVKSTDSPRILLPVKNARTYLKNLEQYDEPLMTWQIYQVKKDDNAGEISRRFNISMMELKEINMLDHLNEIKHGMEILVPRSSQRTQPDKSIVREKPIFLEQYRKMLVQNSTSTIFFRK